VPLGSDRVDDHASRDTTGSNTASPPRVLRDPLAEQSLPAIPRQAAYPDDAPAWGGGVQRVATGAHQRFGIVLFAVDTVALLPPFALAGPRSMVAAWLLTLIIFGWRGLYRSRLSISVLDQLPVLFAAPLVAGSLAVTHDLVRPERVVHYDHTVAAAFLASLSVLVARGLAYWFIRSIRARGIVAHNALILGAGRVGQNLAETLLVRPQFGLRPVAFWDPAPFLAETELSLPVLTEQNLAQAIAASEANVVLIAFGRAAESGMVDIVRTCDRMLCEIFVVPRLFELSQRSYGMDEVWGTPLMRLSRPAFRSKTWQLKRLVDVLVSAVLLLPLAPVLAMCALAVRIEGGKGVIFRQERVGLDGRMFELFKFRSMRAANPDEAATRWSVADDDRVGPVGRLLRRTSLDELPQLINVLRGDMTLVGPRPERPHFVHQFTNQLPRYVARHRVPAGLTGWAQIHGLRGDTSMEERVRFDNYYIENWSLWLDVKILVRTVTAVVRREGA
jgi:exopolysaccharide biosynthesis polyprenyl glycosylphosphotransferase